MPEYQRGKCFNDDRGKMTVLEEEENRVRLAEYNEKDDGSPMWYSYWVEKVKIDRWNVKEVGQIDSEEKLHKIERFCEAPSDQVPKIKKA